MKWFRATTYKRVQTGTDATRNPVYELQATGDSILVRSAPCSPSRDSTDGNAFDLIERTFITRAAPEFLEGIAAIEVGGVLYGFDGMMRDAAPTAMRVRRCKDGIPDEGR